MIKSHVFVHNQLLTYCSPYAGGNLPDGDLSNNRPPSMCRSGNTSDNSRDGDDSGDVFADWNTDTAGVCVVERLLSVTSCDSPGSLPFVDRLTRDGRMSLG